MERLSIKKRILSGPSEKKYLFWRKFGITVFTIFTLTCIRIIYNIGFSQGIFAILSEPRIMHKIGELFLIVPFYFIYLYTYTHPRKRINQMITWSAIPMFIGGSMNAYAWFELKDMVFWHPFCWILFLWGLFAVPISKKFFLPLAK